MAADLGLRGLAFEEVADLEKIVKRLANDGYGRSGGIREYEHAWRMVSVRGSERGSSSPSRRGSTDGLNVATRGNSGLQRAGTRSRAEPVVARETS